MSLQCASPEERPLKDISPTFTATPRRACAPGAHPPGQFQESAAALGVSFKYASKLPAEEGDPRLRDFSGVGLGDLDGDGALDLYFAGGGTADEVYLTGGRGPTRWERSVRAGEGARSRVVTLTDLDEDGDLDALLAIDSPYWVRNNGAGSFGPALLFPREELAPDINYDVYGYAVGDVDRDGTLDILVSIHEELRADGLLWPGAEWLVVWRDDKLQEASGAVPAQSFEDKTFTAAFLDLDDDGDLDVYEVNDAWSAAELGLNASDTQRQGNRLWRNDGPLQFIDATAGSGSGVVTSAMGAAFGDYDNDGLMDLYITTMLPDTNVLLHNDGGLRFTDVAFEMDAGTFYDEHDVGWGAIFLDANADGWLDLYVLHGWHTTGTFPPFNIPANADRQRNLLLINEAGQRFKHDDGGSGLDGDAWSRSPAIGDLNRDGFVDMVVGNADGAPYVYINGCDERPTLTVRLRQTGRNTHAVGARIRATAGSMTQTRTIMAGGEGLFGSSAPEAYFGFPAGTDQVTLKVRWPDGTVQTYDEVPTGHLIDIQRSGSR